MNLAEFYVQSHVYVGFIQYIYGVTKHMPNCWRFRVTVFYWSECKSRKENPQKLTQLSSRSHPRHLVGKRTAQKDTIIDITSDSQVNSNFPYRWSPASLTFNNYFYLFLYLYITWITINNTAEQRPIMWNRVYLNRTVSMKYGTIKM